MVKTQLMTRLSRNISKAGLTIKKHSPEFMLAAGIVGVVTSAVMACKATTKLSEILEETKDNVDKIHAYAADESIPDSMYSAEDEKKDLAIVYAQTGLKIAKNYAPAVALGALSITSILASHNIMHKRNVAIAAAYTAVDNSFKEYRGRVVERFGEALDRELKYNIKAQEIEEVVVDENGEETVVKKTVDMIDDIGYSAYARFYDDGCKGWSKDSARNLRFLVDQQRYANDKLRAKGYLFLNDVYEMLGIPITEDGGVIGWVYDEKCQTLSNRVTFGIFNLHRQTNRDFVNGYERTILLDFNVDGNVYKLLNQ